MVSRWRKIQNRRKGSLIAEAALIFPLIIGAVMAVVYLIIALYSSASIQASENLVLRKVSGLLTGTVFKSGEQGLAQADKFADGRLYGYSLTEAEVSALMERELTGMLSKEKKPISLEEIQVERKAPAVRPSLKVRAEKSYKAAFFVRDAVQRSESGSTTLLDEAEFVRNADFLSEKWKGEA